MVEELAVEERKALQVWCKEEGNKNIFHNWIG